MTANGTIYSLGRRPFESVPYTLYADAAAFTDSSGVAGFADEAAFADSADVAGFADEALFADSADVAGFADEADFADSARVAGFAATSLTATNMVLNDLVDVSVFNNFLPFGGLLTWVVLLAKLRRITMSNVWSLLK